MSCDKQKVMLRDLPFIPRQLLESKRKGFSAIWRIVQEDAQYPTAIRVLRHTGVDHGTGEVTLDLRQVLPLNIASKQFKFPLITADAYGRIIGIESGKVNYSDIENVPDLDKMLSDVVKECASAIDRAVVGLVSGDECRQLIADAIGRLTLLTNRDVDTIVQSWWAEVSKGIITGAQVDTKIKDAVSQIKIPAEVTWAIVHEWIDAAIANGSLQLGGGNVSVDEVRRIIDGYFTLDNDTLITFFNGLLSRYDFKSIIEKYFIDNPLDKPDLNVFFNGASSTGLIYGLVNNQPVSYKYGNSKLIKVWGAPSEETVITMLRNNSPIDVITITTGGQVGWGSSGVLHLGYTDLLEFRVTKGSLAGVSVAVTLPNAGAVVVDTTVPINYPTAPAPANNILHQYNTSVEMNGKVIWLTTPLTDSTFDLSTFEVVTLRAPSKTASFSLWHNDKKVTDFSFAAGSSTGVASIKSGTFVVKRGDFFYMQCHDMADTGAMLWNIDLRSLIDTTIDNSVAVGAAISLQRHEVVRYTALQDMVINLNDSVARAMIVDRTRSSTLYIRVNGGGVGAVLFAANAQSGSFMGNSTFALKRGDILTIEGGSISDLAGFIVNFACRFNDSASYVQEFNASYIGDAPAGTMLSGDLIEKARIVNLAQSVMKLSEVAAAEFVISLHVNDVEVATVTFDVGVSEGRASTDAIVLNIGDRFTVFVKSGIAKRPALNFFYEERIA